MSKAIKSRHGIGEWYGQAFDKMSPSARREWAARELASDDLTGVACPFRAGAKCNKKGGVCSLRLYQHADGQPVTGSGSPVAVCPNRFLEDNLIYRWAGEVLLKTAHPVVLAEIGFLRTLSVSG
ncbi:MAG: hypothetical protein LBD30_00560 [Verrucomicrobiales bacterium]|jgi:hypothetical protein|nr:hypothetical protein [Verrucomicrobiales bacterium]